jgi:hypothetical protein
MTEATESKVKRIRLGKAGNEQVVRALDAWRQAKNRIWDDETMAAILNRQLAGKLGENKHVTSNHLQRARTALGADITCGYVSAVDIATRDAALGLAPAPEPAPNPADALREELFAVRSDVGALLDRIDHALATL